jgi:hypothetical protein
MIRAGHLKTLVQTELFRMKCCGGIDFPAFHRRNACRSADHSLGCNLVLHPFIRRHLFHFAESVLLASLSSCVSSARASPTTSFAVSPSVPKPGLRRQWGGDIDEPGFIAAAEAGAQWRRPRGFAVRPKSSAAIEKERMRAESATRGGACCRPGTGNSRGDVGITPSMTTKNPGKSVTYRGLVVSGMVPRRGLEPPRCYSLVPETSASTNSAIWAHMTAEAVMF